MPNNMLRYLTRLKPSRWLDYAAGLFLILFVILAIRYQNKLLHFTEWGDESETIVAAKMIAAGRTLYSEIFNHHGPLSFFASVLLETFGNFGVPEHRIPVAILQIIGLLSLYFSPILKDPFSKNIYTIFIGTTILLYMPAVYGHTNIYQVYVGLILFIVFAQYTLVSILTPERLNFSRTLAGNFLIASLPLFAITYIPVTILIFFASLRRKHLKASLLAFFLGGFASLLFSMIVGSLPGYLAFHVYLNLEIMPQYSYKPTFWQLAINVFNSVTADSSQLAFLLVLTFSIATLATHEEKFPWRSVLISLGVGSLLIRGLNLHGIPYFYSLAVLSSVVFFNFNMPSNQSRFIGLSFIFICLIKLSLLVPGDSEKMSSGKIPEETEFSILAKKYSEKDDRIIAYTFRNFEYIAADRLPASGYFFYFPWQEKYNENPVYGIKIDACKEIADYRPKVMLIDKWKVWNFLAWDEHYGSCIQQLLDEDYIQIDDKPYYIRRDIFENHKS